MIYTVTLNPSIDYSMFLSHFGEGKINRSDREVTSFGGKGINVSAMLKNLGVESVALGFVGGFSGREIARLAGVSGIECDFCEIRDDSRINVKIISERESAINGLGPLIRLEEEEMLVSKLRGLSSEDTVIISGSAPDSESGKLLQNIIDAASGAKLVADMEGDSLRYAIEKKPFLIKPNYDELCALFGSDSMDIGEIAGAAVRLREMGAENVAVSLGKDGALLAAGDGNLYRMRAPEIKAVSTVGAGDSFLAGFLAGLSRDMQFALALGVAAGSATASCSGIADTASVMEILSEM